MREIILQALMFLWQHKVFFGQIIVAIILLYMTKNIDTNNNKPNPS